MRWLTLGLALLALTLPAAATERPLRLEVLADGLEHPWGLAFLPDGAVLITEREGRLRLWRGGRLAEVRGVPRVLTGGQAGLFDVALHPGFASNRVVYLSFAHGSRRANVLRVVRGRLEGDRLADVQTVWQAEPPKRGLVHFGGRMLFLPDGTLLVTTGDAFDRREDAQRLSLALGKVVRLREDGEPAPRNPFAARPGARPEIFTLGHRNPQGLAMDPATGRIWLHDHGPRGGDEVNLLRTGANYGWPVATSGRDYSGATVTPFRRYPGMVEPVHEWTPSIAPSGLAVYRGALFPEWAGDLLVGGLVSQDVRRLRLDAGGRVVAEVPILGRLAQRVRDVRVAPDGSVWLLTDEARGQMLRVTPGG